MNKFDIQLDPVDSLTFGEDWKGAEIYVGEANVFQYAKDGTGYINLDNSKLTEVDLFAANKYKKLGLYHEEMLYQRGPNDIFTAQELLEEIETDWEKVNTNG